jgi:hypothetical protein
MLRITLVLSSTEAIVAPLRSWGVSYQGDYVHSPGYDCPHCHWKDQWANLRIKTLVPYIVGFDATLTKGAKLPGAFIIECPKCFEKFWFHAAAPSVDLLKLMDAWPK